MFTSIKKPIYKTDFKFGIIIIFEQMLFIMACRYLLSSIKSNRFELFEKQIKNTENNNNKKILYKLK